MSPTTRARRYVSFEPDLLRSVGFIPALGARNKRMGKPD